MATFTKINNLPEALAEKQMDLSSDTISIALSNTAPGSETSDPTADGNGVLANVTQIAYTNYSDDMAVDRVLEGVTSLLSGGTWTLNADNLVITASGGAIADFRYIYIFDETSVTPDDQLIAVIDQGSVISLTVGQTATITWHASGIINNA